MRATPPYRPAAARVPRSRGCSGKPDLTRRTPRPDAIPLRHDPTDTDESVTTLLVIEGTPVRRICDSSTRRRPISVMVSRSARSGSNREAPRSPGLHTRAVPCHRRAVGRHPATDAGGRRDGPVAVQLVDVEDVRSVQDGEVHGLPGGLVQVGEERGEDVADRRVLLGVHATAEVVQFGTEAGSRCRPARRRDCAPACRGCGRPSTCSARSDARVHSRRRPCTPPDRNW